MGDGDLPWRLVETRVSSNIKQALDYWHMFFERCVGWKCGWKWHGTLFAFFLGPVYSFTKQIPRDDIPFFSEFLSNDFKDHVHHVHLPVLQNFSRQMCVCFFPWKPIGLGRENHPWCRLSWKHFWGYHLIHPSLKVWAWLLLWHPPHSTMKHCHSPSRGPTAFFDQERAWPGPGIWGGSVLIGKARSVAVDNVLPWHLFACLTNRV